MRFTMHGTFAALAIVALIGPAAAAPLPKGEVKADRSAAEMIRKALDSSGNFDFSGVTLAGVMNTISEQYKINIVIDRTVLQQMGFEPEGMNVELKMKEGKLRNALRGIVGQYNLTFATIGDSLVITTEEVAVYRQLKQRISVDYSEMPLNKAVKDLATRYGVNVVVDPRTVKTKAADNPVTLQVDDVPFEAAIRLLCEMADLKPARMGNVIFVTTEGRADRLKDGDSLVPTPGLPTPGLPGVFPGALGGIGGGGLVVPALPVAPPAIVNPPPPAVTVGEDKPPPADSPKKEEPKKEEPKRP
jgi:type II secretory pathway component GspD/PulD (secretin)